MTILIVDIPEQIFKDTWNYQVTITPNIFQFAPKIRQKKILSTVQF